LTVDSLAEVLQRRCLPTGKNVFLEELELVRAKNRRTALCRVVVVVITREAIESTHQVVVNALKRFSDQTCSDYAFAKNAPTSRSNAVIARMAKMRSSRVRVVWKLANRESATRSVCPA